MPRPTAIGMIPHAVLYSGSLDASPGEYQHKIRRFHPPQRERGLQPSCVQGETGTPHGENLVSSAAKGVAYKLRVSQKREETCSPLFDFRITIKCITCP